MSLGFFFLVITFFQVGGIPLLDKALRFNLDTSWAWAPAIFFYMFGSVGLIMNVKERKQAYLIILVSTVLFALTGFRFALLLVLLSGTIAAYKSKKLDNKTVLIPLATAVLLVLFLGYFVAGLANPATLFLWRSSTTYNVYDQVLDQSMPFGVEHGKFLLNHAQPRDYLGEFLGAENSLTSTMLGPPLMEFGPIFALTWMFFLGVILGNAYISIEKKESLMRVFYPVLLALSIVWIETGFDQHMLWFIWTYLIMRWLK
jgi:uncharacterized membrane protein